ncbi:hypothetical protein COP2_010820 [Malus domestica]
MILDIGNYRNVEESCQMPSSIPQGTPASRGAVYVVEEAQSEKLRFQTSRLKATSGLSLPLRGPPPKANSCISMDASLEGQTYMKVTPMQIVHLKLLLFIY